jgi:hypothetical protein
MRLLRSGALLSHFHPQRRHHAFRLALSGGAIRTTYCNTSRLPHLPLKFTPNDKAERHDRSFSGMTTENGDEVALHRSTRQRTVAKAG